MAKAAQPSKLPPTLPRVPPPTAEQLKWLNSHKAYQRMSHAAGAKFTQRGTLWPDGRFVPEGPKAPVMDGNGAFGVGIFVPPPRRR